jgi:hypothetical protein
MFELITVGLKLEKEFHDSSKSNPQAIRCYYARKNAYLPKRSAELAASAEDTYQNRTFKNIKYFRDTMLRKVRILRKINLEQAFMLRILCGKTAGITYSFYKTSHLRMEARNVKK